MPYGTMATDRYVGIDFAKMREYRLARTRKYMEEYNIGTLVTWEPWDIRYIAGGYATIPCRWGKVQYVVLPRNGDPHAFITTSFSPFALREEMPWLKGKVWQDQRAGKSCSTIAELENCLNVIMGIINEHGLANEVVGIDGCANELLWRDAFATKGMSVVDAKPMMFDVRKIKCQEEIECVRLACSIAEAAFADMQMAIKPGVRECELMGTGMKRLYSLGADEVMEFVVASGPRTNPLHIDFTDRIIRPGELVAIDVNGNSYNGYKSCYYRTFCCGKATQEQKDAFKIAKDMMYAGIEKIVAGNTLGDVVDQWPDDPAFWGKTNKNECSCYAMAHGIGLSLHEAPMFSMAMPKDSEKRQQKFQVGQVMAIETWYGPPGADFGVRLEECIAVTENGYDLLTKYPIDELIECDY